MLGYYFVFCDTIMTWACVTRKVSVVSHRVHNSIIDNYCSSPVYYIALLSTGRNEAYRSIPAWVYHVLWLQYVVSSVLGARNKFLILHKVIPLVARQRLVKGLAFKPVSELDFLKDSYYSRLGEYLWAFTVTMSSAVYSKLPFSFRFLLTNTFTASINCGVVWLSCSQRSNFILIPCLSHCLFKRILFNLYLSDFPKSISTMISDSFVTRRHTL